MLWSTLPGMLSRTLSSTLPSMLPSILSRGNTLPISLDYMLPCMLLGARSRLLPSCRGQEPDGGWQVVGGRLQVAGGRLLVAGGRWQVAGSGWCVAKIMASVDIIVWFKCGHWNEILQWHIVTVLSIAAFEFAREVDNSISWSADLRLRFCSRISNPLPTDHGYMCSYSVWSWQWWWW